MIPRPSELLARVRELQAALDDVSTQLGVPSPGLDDAERIARELRATLEQVQENEGAGCPWCWA